MSSLSISAANISFQKHHSLYFQSTGRDLMHKLHVACRNLKNLAIVIKFDDLSGLQYIFREIITFKELKLEFHGLFPPFASNIWDLYYLVCQLYYVKALEKYHEFMDFKLVSPLPPTQNLTGNIHHNIFSTVVITISS